MFCYSPEWKHFYTLLKKSFKSNERVLLKYFQNLLTFNSQEKASIYHKGSKKKKLVQEHPPAIKTHTSPLNMLLK